MKSFSRFLWVDALRSILAVVFKRLRFHAGLSLSSAVGIVSILGLVVAVPVFTNGVLSQVLKEQLTEKAALNHRSLFSFHAYYPDNEAYYPLTLKQARGIVQFLRDEFE